MALFLFLQGCPGPFGFTSEVPREGGGTAASTWTVGMGLVGGRLQSGGPRLLLPSRLLAQVVQALCASVSSSPLPLRKVSVSLDDTHPMKLPPATLRRVGHPLNSGRRRERRSPTEDKAHQDSSVLTSEKLSFAPSS